MKAFGKCWDSLVASAEAAGREHLFSVILFGGIMAGDIEVEVVVERNPLKGSLPKIREPNGAGTLYAHAMAKAEELLEKTCVIQQDSQQMYMPLVMFLSDGESQKKEDAEEAVGSGLSSPHPHHHHHHTSSLHLLFLLLIIISFSSSSAGLADAGDARAVEARQFRRALRGRR